VKTETNKEKDLLPRLRTRLPDRDADEFWNYLQVLILFISFFILYIFANIVLTTYSFKKDVETLW
jgi:hypothetical protein